MSKTLLIIISGLPCTGKTTLGKKIAKQLCLPFVSKDDIKESLFDVLGWSDREWSIKLTSASYVLLYNYMESLLSAGISFIAESNFSSEYDNEKFLNLSKKYCFEPFQVICKTKEEVLFERFKTRSESGERHPGHVDRLNYEGFKETLSKGKYESLNIGGEVFEVDTTNFDAINYDKLFKAIKSVIKQFNI